jgi:hypothetical protein
MKMQAGSAVVHCAFATRHLPLEQNWPEGQVTAAQALSAGLVAGGWQVPSGRHLPSPQSASLVQPGLTLMSQLSSTFGSQACGLEPLPHAAASNPIAHSQ